MKRNPEDCAREEIDHLLAKANWDVQDSDHINIHSHVGVAIQDFALKQGSWYAVTSFTVMVGLRVL